MEVYDWIIAMALDPEVIPGQPLIWTNRKRV
jgi:hypothetical protein